MLKGGILMFVQGGPEEARGGGGGRRAAKEQEEQEVQALTRLISHDSTRPGLLVLLYARSMDHL